MAKEFYFMYGSKSEIYDSQGNPMIDDMKAEIEDLTISTDENKIRKYVYDCKFKSWKYEDYVKIYRRFAQVAFMAEIGVVGVYFNDHRVCYMHVSTDNPLFPNRFQIIIEVDRKDIKHEHEVRKNNNKWGVALMVLDYAYTGKISAEHYSFLMDEADWEDVDKAARVCADRFEKMSTEQQGRVAMILGKMAIKEYIRRKED